MVQISRPTSTTGSMGDYMRFPFRVGFWWAILLVLAVTQLLVGVTFLTRLSKNDASTADSMRRRIRTNDEEGTSSSSTSSSSSSSHAAVAVSDADPQQQLQQLPDKTIVWAGLIKSTKEIQFESWNILAELSCLYQVRVHIIAGQAIEEGRTEYRKRKAMLEEKHRAKGSPVTCADFIIEQEDVVFEGRPTDHRIERLVYLRDYQREVIRSMLQPEDDFSGNGLQNKYVITADMDLAFLPPVKDYISRIYEEDLRGMDVICAGGRADIIPFLWSEYYDQVATVFWPDTYAYPVSFRHIKKLFDTEDPSLASYTFFRFPTLWSRIVQEAAQTDEHVMPVRSCYGGLAIYRASVFLNPHCKYDMDTSRHMRFSNQWVKRPCEHIIFHDCLHAQYSTVKGQPSSSLAVLTASTLKVVVDPELITSWKTLSILPFLRFLLP